MDSGSPIKSCVLAADCNWQKEQEGDDYFALLELHGCIRGVFWGLVVCI